MYTAPIDRFTFSLSDGTCGSTVAGEEQVFSVLYELREQCVLDVIVCINEGGVDIFAYFCLFTDNEVPGSPLCIASGRDKSHRSGSELRSQSNIRQRVNRFNRVRYTEIEVLYGTDIDIGILTYEILTVTGLVHEIAFVIGLNTLVGFEGVCAAFSVMVITGDRNRGSYDTTVVHHISCVHTCA